jgi:hypothetical protein
MVPDILLTSIAHDRPFLEDKMTQNQSLCSAAAAFATVAFMAVPGLMGSAQAATGDLYSCHFNSRGKTIDCCQQYVNSYGAPLWMRDSETSCSEAVVCGSGGNYRCRIQAVLESKDSERSRGTSRGRRE